MLEESISERRFMESLCNVDDTLPLPDEVAQEFSDKVGDGLTAVAWLADHGIDTAPEHIALIQYGTVRNPDTGRYRFVIYGPDHVGPKYPAELAIPIIENGEILDLLVISDEMSFDRITCRAPWLGRENLAAPVVRLHAHPMDWLEAGCTGACHIEPISRKALKELSQAATIECNCIHTVLEAWSWGFSDDDDELARFVIDGSPFSIRSYFEDEVRWRTAYLARALS
ncbi:hypothetical protein UP10_08530 [Bradyrhizobium sp. LTSPM299]|uniref:hypothetical protein n=1 Tax=Bradyrhizobium sp. LTSPM299 TaxID=1619233 RepID=UPI0005C84FAB|nr:hypothetical protein [Bradyrhizobium sp. LTSPM299]KJC60963.1 hypothetical protein UP10_08530 [Bradyrhizobium sp. LTSPM299]